MDPETLTKLIAMHKNKAGFAADAVQSAADPGFISDSCLEELLAVTENDIQELENSILAEFTEQNIGQLIAECREKVLYSIVTPLGLGKLVSLGLFGQADRLGGNVDTIHNARQTDENGKPVGTEKFQKKYEEHLQTNAYNKEVSAQYHSDSRYIAKNREMSAARKAGEAVDAYTGNRVAANEKLDQDHIISAYEVHNDPGRILSGVDGRELANADSNLVGTSSSLNRSKKAMSMSEYIEKLQAESEKRKERIEVLKNKEQRSDKEQAELNKLEKQEEADLERMAELDEAARKEYNKTINHAYYTSKEFQMDLLVTSSKEAVKMGLQQAFGLFLVDLSNGFIDELIDSYKNGFIQGTEEDTFFKACEVRLKRVADKVCSDWKKLVTAFKDGIFSGFISNVITTLINTFITTAKTTIRVIREGTKILFDAFKTVLLPAPGKNALDKWDAALKVIVSGAITTGGIVLQDTFEKCFVSVSFLGNYGTLFATMISGIVTGLSVSVALYGLDKWDPFGAKDLKKRRFLRDRIQEKGQASKAFLDEMCMKHGIE